MAKAYSFTIENLKKSILQKAVPIFQEAGDELYLEIQQNSPVDSGYYLSRHHNKGVRQEGDTIIAEVENIGEYPEKVEDGWRKTEVNWHLNNGQVIQAKGAKVYVKSVRKVGDKLLSKLR